MFWKREKPQKDVPGERSPLDEIRQEEAHIASQVLQARQDAETIILEAQARAVQMVAEAQREGSQAGQARCRQDIQAAELQAQQILTIAARHLAPRDVTPRLLASDDSGEQASLPRTAAAARWALTVVLGLEREERKP